MTVGSWSIGSSDAPIRAQKAWSGADDPMHTRENAYTMTHISCVRGGQTIRKLNGVPQYEYLWLESNNWCPPMGAFDSNSELALLGKLADLLRQGAPNLGASLGESAETWDLLNRSVVAAFQGYRYFRQGNYTLAVRAWVHGVSGKRLGRVKPMETKHVSDAHLALQYGWVPLASDIYDLAQFIERRTTEPRKLIYRVQKTVSVAGDTSSNGSVVIPCKGKVTVALKYVATEQVSAPRALGLYNPLAVAWELVPGSFVADWFIPIGQYLDLLGMFPFLEYSCCRTEYARSSSDFTLGVVDLGYGLTNEGGSIRTRAHNLRRIPGFTISVPRPGFKSVERAFSLQHIRNAAALIWSNIGSVKRLGRT